MGAIRKVSLAVVAAALVLALGATPAFARGNGSAQRGTQRQLRSSTATRYVDADGDGICDNRGTNFVDADGDGVRDCRGVNFIDTDGDGICDNRGTGAGFVDADGDGVCDNYGTYGHHGGTGNGSGNGYRGGRF